MRADRFRKALETLGNAIHEVDAMLQEAKAEQDPLATHIFLARRNYGKALDGDTKSGKRSDREAVDSWRTACDLGFRGDLSEWRRLLGAMPRR